MALMLSQASSSTKVAILDLAKFAVYILSFKLKKCITFFYSTEQTGGIKAGLLHHRRKVSNLSESDRDA